MPEVTELFPDHNVIDRSSMNGWIDTSLQKAVHTTGRKRFVKRFVVAGLWP
jgi:hypothetical protein